MEKEIRNITVRIPDQEAIRMLGVISKTEKRTMGNELAVLIRERYAQMFSQPNPLITVEEAVQAGKAVAGAGD